MDYSKIFNQTADLNKTFNMWLENHGFETRVRSVNEFGFFYYNSLDVIEYCFALPENSIISWEKLMEELNCPYVIDQFYTSFLHELGHAETIYLLTDEELTFSEDETERLAELESSIETDMMYYHLPREIEATKWAVNYIKNNPEDVKELIDITQPFIQQILHILVS